MKKKSAEAELPGAGEVTLVNLYHKVSTVTLDGIKGEVLTEFSLSNNYPNPFNPTTTIKFNISAPSKVQLLIYNILGQRIKTLVSGQMEAGAYKIMWDGLNDHGVRVSSGIYLYQLISDGKIINTRKMMMIK